MTNDERAIELIASQFGKRPEDIRRDMTFVNDLGADSLDLVELIMEGEEEFDVTIPDAVAEQWNTVGDALDWMNRTIPVSGCV